MNDGSPRKRRRTMMRLYPDEEERDALDHEGYPPDEPALQLLRSQYPAKAQEVIVPFMLRSQLYSLVDDRTLVDRELDELRFLVQERVW
ncbi:TPA: hypothetical protein ACH3X2_008379 [Trebouxia sp. C0005]